MQIRLVGVFEMRDSLGRDCTPRGAKSRALLAMLCQTPDRRRTRRWLEAKLWSDRAPEQASGSLRQALMDIRRAMGDGADLLHADRDSIRLAEVSTDLQDAAAVTASLMAGREFLEGIDIVDQAFVDWLRDERARIDTVFAVPRVVVVPPAAAPPVAQMPARMPFVIRLGSLPAGVGSFMGMALADSIGRLMAEFAHIDTFGAGGAALPPDLPPEGMLLHVEGAQIGDRIHILVSLSTLSHNQAIWNQRVTLPMAQADFISGGTFPSLVFQAAEAALSHVPRLSAGLGGAWRANALIARALPEMFSYDAARLRDADDMLVQALAIAPSARAYAWRSLVRQIMYVERTEPDQTRLTEEADAYARKALELSRANPLVLALVSAVRVMVDENPEAGTVLARDSVALSPFNAFGYAAQAGAMIRAGQFADALAAARTGAEIAARTSYVHWWESLSGLAAIRAGMYDVATAHCEAAHYRSPTFRGAMRPLLFLYLAAGAREKAARVLRNLQRAEPDFSLALIRDDPDYPAMTLRRAGLIARYGGDLEQLMKGRIS
ncbi:MAG: hypothetical protein V4712_16855 [Pseudomonadota bacterium]